jgi:hypothetical protein
VVVERRTVRGGVCGQGPHNGAEQHRDWGDFHKGRIPLRREGVSAREHWWCWRESSTHRETQGRDG